MINIAFLRSGRRKPGTRSAGALLATGIVLALLTLVTGPLTGAARAQASPTFGSVNIDEVVQQSKAHQSDMKELSGLLATLQRVNTQLAQGPGLFLSDAELRELAGLYEKETLTEAEKKRVAQLEQAGEGRKSELTRLESTAAPTDEQRRRFNELGTIRQQGQQNLQGLGDDFQKRLRTRQDELEGKTVGQIRDAIASVAKSKNLAVVFNSTVALYTANDITADVIKQVNK